MTNIAVVLFAGASALIALAGFVLSRDKTKIQNAEAEGVVRGTTNAKLDSINNTLADVKNDISKMGAELNNSVNSIRNDTNDLRERVVKIEESIKSAHKRIDGLGKVTNTDI